MKINPKIRYLPPKAGEIDNFVADMTKLKHLFGEIPDTKLEIGLEKHSGGLTIGLKKDCKTMIVKIPIYSIDAKCIQNLINDSSMK